MTQWRSRLGSCTDDHLSALPGGGERGRAVACLPLRLDFRNAVADPAHGGEHILAGLLRREMFEGLFGGQLDVDAQPVRQQTGIRYRQGCL